MDKFLATKYSLLRSAGHGNPAVNYFIYEKRRNTEHVICYRIEFYSFFASHIF